MAGILYQKVEGQLAIHMKVHFNYQLCYEKVGGLVYNTALLTQYMNHLCNSLNHKEALSRYRKLIPCIVCKKK